MEAGSRLSRKDIKDEEAASGLSARKCELNKYAQERAK